MTRKLLIPQGHGRITLPEDTSCGAKTNERFLPWEKKSPGAEREPAKYQRLCKTYPPKNCFPSFTENSQPHWWFGIVVRREGNLMFTDLLLYYISMNAATYTRSLKFFINYVASGKRYFFNNILLYPIRPIQSSNAWHKNFINTSTPIYNLPVPQVLTS